MDAVIKLCTSNKNIIYWYMNKLHEITDETHNAETNGNSLAYLREFLLRRFGATGKELISVADELLRNLDEFTNFVGHNGVR